jgi:hypothetical protein
MEASGQLHAPVAIPPRERAPGGHWIGGWMSHREGLSGEKSCLCRESNLDSPVHSPSQYLLSSSGSTKEGFLVKMSNRRYSALIIYHHCGGCGKKFASSIQIVVADLEDVEFNYFKIIHKYKLPNSATGAHTQNVEWV